VVLEALQVLGAQRVFLATPYPDAVNAHEIQFLAHHGFRCLTMIHSDVQ
jgi:maleate cis-trans isomerase